MARTQSRTRTRPAVSGDARRRKSGDSAGGQSPDSALRRPDVALATRTFTNAGTLARARCCSDAGQVSIEIERPIGSEAEDATILLLGIEADSGFRVGGTSDKGMFFEVSPAELDQLAEALASAIATARAAGLIPALRVSGA